MKYAVMMVALLFSCAGANRIAPRDVSRIANESRDRAELVDGLEAAIDESNRLRGELVDAPQGDGVSKPAVDYAPVGRMPRLIVFTAVEWCAPCRKLDAEIDRLSAMTYVTPDGQQHTWSENIGTDNDNAIQVVDISEDAETPEQALAVKYRVTGVPTMVRIDVDGKEESRFTGLLVAETLCLYQAGKWRPPKPVIDMLRVVTTN